MSLVFIFLLPVEKTSAPTAPADASKEPTEHQPETSTEDADATSSEPAEDTVAQDASPDPGSDIAEPFPEAYPLEEMAPEQEVAPELEVPDEETPKDSSTNTEPAPDETLEATNTGNEGAAGAEPGAADAADAAGAAAESAGGEDSAQVQMCSEGKVCFCNISVKEYPQILTKP